MTATHTFERSGGYNVSLSVTDDSGETAETVRTLTVASGTQDDTDTGASGPGFGIGAALTSLGGLGYLLKRRLTDDE